VSDLVDRLERPLITDRASYAPHVEWSTWESQGAHGETIAARLEEAAVLSNALRDTVAELIENEPLDLTRARVVAEYVNESTRSIHYDDSHWELKPRTASRIWETAYGHRLDRAVLAAALFREAGLAARFVYRTRGYAGPGSGDVLSLARYDGIAVWVSGDGLEAYYDPESGTLDLGTTELAGRALWFAGDASGLPEVAARGAAPNVYELRVTLEPGEEGGFAGTGFVDLRGGLAPYDRTVGLDGECAGYLERVAAAAASGASLGEHGVVQMRRDRLTAGFGFDVEAPEPDGQGRIELGVGDPPGGILDRLPDDVHLYDAERGSPLTLFGPMRQTITLRLKIGEREAVRLPEPRSIENPLGRFSLSVEEEDGWITMTREVAVGTSRTDAESSESSPTIVAPEEWPLLRELLLEEADRANRAILLR
jgi:hypothetical protein